MYSSPSPPILLAIEASQRRAGVAVRDGAGDVDAEWLRAGARHDEDLLAAIDRLYRRRGLTPGMTGAVAVSIGPGGFTGLRVSIAAAKMLGEALGAALVAVESAHVAAEGHRGPGPVLVALGAKGDTVWASRLARGGAGWEEQGVPGVTASPDLGGIEAVLADEYLPASLRAECARVGVPVLAPALDPRQCLAVAARRLAEGRTTDPLRLAPLYARPPEAVEPGRRRPA